jgi:hypothetical protein
MDIKSLYKKFLKHKPVSAPKSKIQGKQTIPVSKMGLWDRGKNKVIVPSNRITMKGPKGEQDFFKRPVLATGLQSSKQVMMQPGREYYFPEDEAVFEKRMQTGGKIDLTEDIAVLLNRKEDTFDKVLNYADLTTDVMQAGHFIPHPIGQAVGYVGDFAGAGVDALQSMRSASQGNYTDAAVNAGLALLPMGAGKQGYKRANSLVSGKGSGYYRPLQPLPHLKNSPVIQKGIGWNRATLGANALEVGSNINLNLNNNQNTNFRGYQDNTRVAPVVRPVKPKMQSGGLSGSPTKLASSDEEKFSQFFTTLPPNLRVDNNSYDIRGYWDALGRPDAFDYNQPKEEDGMYHAFSRHARSGKMLKSMSHPTAQMAIEGDKAAGYSHAMDPSGNVYSFSPNDMPTEGPYSFKDGGKKVRFPKFKPFLRTSPAGNAGYSDNTTVAPQVNPKEITKKSEDYLENFERIEQVEVKAKKRPKKTMTLKEAYESFKNSPKYRFGESNTTESTRVDRINPEVSAYPPEYFTAKGDRDGITKKVVDFALKGLPTNVGSLARVALQQDNTQSNIKDDELKVLGNAINSATREGKEVEGSGTFGYENYPGGRKPLSEIYANLLGYKDKGFKQTLKDRLKAAATDSEYRKAVSDAFSDPSFQMQTTVGQGRFKKLPNGDYLVYDDYDFNFHSEGEKQNLLNDLEDKAGETDLFHSKTAYIVPKSYVKGDTDYTEREAGYLKKAEQEAIAPKPIVEEPIQQTVNQPIQQPKTIPTMSSDTTKVNPTPTKTKALAGERLKVQNYQKMLNEKYGAGLDADGAWGPKTQAAYEKYILNKQMQGGGTIQTSMINEVNQEDSLPILLDALFSQYQKTKQEFGIEEEGEEQKLQMQDGADTSTEQNPERIEQVHIKSKQDPWYKRYPRMVGRAIDNKLSDFGHQYAQRISNATGGSEWYKQSNPFMNVALESMNAPQLAATYAVTGKVQTPSEAMDIQNPYGAFVVDALLDPSAALTLGSRSVSRLASSALDTYANQLAKQIRKSPKLSFALEHRRPVFNTQNVQVRPGLSLDNIQPMQDYLTSNTKGSISEYDFLRKLDEGSGSLDNSLKKRIADLQSKEGFNRLVNQERDFLIREGEVSSVADQLAPINAQARIEELQNTYNVNKAAGNYIKSVNPNKLSSFARETLVDNAFHSPANPHYDYSPSTSVLDFAEPKPGSIGIGHTYVGHKPTEMHEIAHSLQRARQLPLDDELRLLKPKNFENSDYKYFSEGSNLQEPTAFANELREAMLEKGLIPDYYSPISETQVKDAYKYFKNNPSGIYDPNTGNFSSDTRIFDFMAPTKENNKILTDVLNKLPAAVPIGTGIGVGAFQINKKKSGMQMGGMSIPGVNGTVVASGSLYSKTKKRKK